mgnify:CR=1 FL=1
MKISYRQDGEITIAEIEGHLDTMTSTDAEISLMEAVDNGASNLLIDFQKLEFISSAGLRTLLGLAKRQKKDGGKLHLAGMNDIVREVLVISGFDTIIESSSTVDEALDRMRD